MVVLITRKGVLKFSFKNCLEIVLHPLDDKSNTARATLLPVMLSSHDKLTLLEYRFIPTTQSKRITKSRDDLYLKKSYRARPIGTECG